MLTLDDLVLHVGFPGSPGRNGLDADVTPAMAQMLARAEQAAERAEEAANTPVQHDHNISDVSGLGTALASKADTGHTHSWSTITDRPLTFPAEVHSHEIGTIPGLHAELLRLEDLPPKAHTHAILDVDGLQPALDGKAAISDIPTTESLQDLVAAMFQAGSHTNASIIYNDTTGTLNITAVGGGGTGTSLTQEEVEDFVGRLTVQGTGISVSYDDVGNVLQIALAGESYTTADKNKLAAIAAGATANQTDAHLLARDNHTGTQAISTIAGLQAILDGKAAQAHTHVTGDIPELASVIADLGDVIAELRATNTAQLAVNADLTARIAALEGGTVVTPPPGPQPDLSPYQPDMTTGRIAQITTSFGGRPNVTPATYYFDGQDEMAAMAMGA